MRKVTRTHFEDEDDDMVRGTVWIHIVIVTAFHLKMETSAHLKAAAEPTGSGAVGEWTDDRKSDLCVSPPF